MPNNIKHNCCVKDNSQLECNNYVLNVKPINIEIAEQMERRCVYMDFISTEPSFRTLRNRSKYIPKRFVNPQINKFVRQPTDMNPFHIKPWQVQNNYLRKPETDYCYYHVFTKNHNKSYTPQGINIKKTYGTINTPSCSKSAQNNIITAPQRSTFFNEIVSYYHDDQQDLSFYDKQGEKSVTFPISVQLKDEYELMLEEECIRIPYFYGHLKHSFTDIKFVDEYVEETCHLPDSQLDFVPSATSIDDTVCKETLSMISAPSDFFVLAKQVSEETISIPTEHTDDYFSMSSQNSKEQSVPSGFKSTGDINVLQNCHSDQSVPAINIYNLKELTLDEKDKNLI